jgi:phosphotriesterase-related protein
MSNSHRSKPVVPGRFVFALRVRQVANAAFLLLVAATAFADTDMETDFRQRMAGKIMTVLGPIQPADAGITLPHEHLFIDFRLPLDEPWRWSLAQREFPGTDDLRELWHTPITLQNLAFVRSNIWQVEEALLIEDEDVVLGEVAAFRKAGGGTIVDVTTIGLGRNAGRLARLAQESGLHIVMGAGWYQEAWRPESFDQRSVDSLADEMVRDIVSGVDGGSVQAGIIGEIPAMTIITEPADSSDVRQLRAAARASHRTGATISLHQWVGDGSQLMKTLDILEAEGADLSRVIVGHIGGDAAAHLPLLEQALARGVTLQTDLFGVPFYLNRPSLDNRIMADLVVNLIAKGYSRQLLLSHDVCTRLQQKAYGGHGLDYVLFEVVPYLRGHGASDSQIEDLLIRNPARLLAFPEPSGK